ncbi:MAG: sulfatase family protein [Draconibacterium sp.]
MRHIYILFKVLLIIVFFSCANNNTKNEKTETPNIIYILADDMGYGDIMALNKESKIETPHLDRLVAEGMSFFDAHSNSAVCTPTRYGILTGRYCFRSRLKSSVLYGYSPALIEGGRTTVASFLKEQGYQTACIGKWHLGLGWAKKDPEQPLFEKLDNWEIGLVTNCDYTKPVHAGPNSVGFDYSYILPGSLDMAPYVYVENHKVTAPVIQKLNAENSERGVFYRAGEMAEGFNITKTLDHFTDKAVEYINKASGQKKPFFLYFPLTAPHTPWLPSENFRGKSGAGIYGDFVMHVDDVVGRIVEATKNTGTSENTIIVFTSDNGSDWKEEDIEKWQHRANFIYSGRKSDVWEGGHRVPFIVKWPGKVQSDTQSGQQICTTDWLATCADMLNKNLEGNEGEDSYSFLPSLLNETYDESYRGAVIHHSLPGEFAIRKSDWKYIDCRGSGGWTTPGRESDPPGQLYNIKNDPKEQDNLYLKMPDKVAELKELLKQYQTKASI